jgi:hypothetical protein
VATLVDGQLYDIVYMGDKDLKMFKYHNTLYIIDPKIDSTYQVTKSLSKIGPSLSEVWGLFILKNKRYNSNNDSA